MTVIGILKTVPGTDRRSVVMYGKHFASMYSGSMVGAGTPVFAVMGYVIANMKPDSKVGSQVELNPKLMGFIFGEKEEVVSKAIAFLCAPDPNSRTSAEGGRRLKQIGTFDYQVVNGVKYLKIRDEEERRESNRLAKQRERDRKRGIPLPGETAYVKAAQNGATPAQLDQMTSPNGRLND